MTKAIRTITFIGVLVFALFLSPTIIFGATEVYWSISPKGLIDIPCEDVCPTLTTEVNTGGYCGLYNSTTSCSLFGSGMANCSASLCSTTSTRYMEQGNPQVGSNWFGLTDNPVDFADWHYYAQYERSTTGVWTLADEGQSGCSGGLSSLNFEWHTCATGTCDFALRGIGYNIGGDFDSLVYFIKESSTSTWIVDNATTSISSYADSRPTFFSILLPDNDGWTAWDEGIYDFLYLMYDSVTDTSGCYGSFQFTLDEDLGSVTKTEREELEDLKRELYEVELELSELAGLFGYVKYAIEDLVDAIKERFPFSWVFETADLWEEKAEEHATTSMSAFAVTWTIASSTPYLGGAEIMVIDFTSVVDDYGTYVTLFRTILLSIVWLITIFVIFDKVKNFIAGLTEAS